MGSNGSALLFAKGRVQSDLLLSVDERLLADWRVHLG